MGNPSRYFNSSLKVNRNAVMTFVDYLVSLGQCRICHCRFNNPPQVTHPANMMNIRFGS